ncbi:hypothetical protein [Dorea sp. D27]|uniref:hypothetical protein n=1 Tax=Dorea sp. D27 TaxID=658665 RepID=UPI0006734950|nr:hypothetical protein [Dorea sp. D27]
MTNYEIVTCVISCMAVVVSAFAAWFTYRNLKEIRNQFFEQNRGNLVFSITEVKKGAFRSTVLKNYGNSPARLISLKITPELKWSDVSDGDYEGLDNNPVLSNCKNVFLAPNQFISSDFYFEGYPHETFNVEINYETCGKIFSISYAIDLRYGDNLVTSVSDTKEQSKILKEISHNIEQLSDRFL